jgi:hypothetical protein
MLMFKEFILFAKEILFVFSLERISSLLKDFLKAYEKSKNFENPVEKLSITLIYTKK